jgi:hypothetical protein
MKESRMGLHKADISIGQRAAAEILDRAMDKPVRSMMKAIGIRWQCWYEWNEGVCPATFALQKLALAGYDVQYILTGKKRGLDVNMLGIEEVSEGTGLHIIRSYNPPDSCGRLGKYIYPEGDRWIGIDNSTGDCWVEAFTTRAECVAWLTGKEM